MNRRLIATALIAIGLVLTSCGGSSEEVQSGHEGSASGSVTSIPAESASTVPVHVYPPELVTNPGWSVFSSEDPTAAIMEAEVYETVAEQAAASSTVLRGRIRQVELGRVFGEDEGVQVVYVTMLVEPEKVLAGGEPETVNGMVRLEFAIPGIGDPDDAGSVIEHLAQLNAGEPTIFFLRHKADEAAALGMSEEQIEAERGWYRLVASTGLATSDGGRADATIYLPHHDNPPIVVEIESADMATLEESVAQ